MLSMIALETVADNQQWRFQTGKKRQVAADEALDPDFAKGFLDQGLWSRSRHPNYFAEQVIWIAFYGFSVAASGQWLNWSVSGCLLLVILFQGSARFSEEISLSKYPKYRRYQETVPRFIPRLVVNSGSDHKKRHK